MGQNKDAIRLTNKTAIALRRSAKRIEKISLIAALVITLVLCVMTVLLGISNLFVVPVMIPVIIALDVVIIAFSRSYYLMLLSQAICTEASAREMRERAADKRRRERAISDLKDIREDMRGGESMERMAQSALRAFAMDEEDEDDEDMAPPVHKPVRNASAPVRPIPPTAPVAPAKPAAAAVTKTNVIPPMGVSASAAGGRMNPYEDTDDRLQKDDAPRRRRRRSAPTLHVIHGDQAK